MRPEYPPTAEKGRGPRQVLSDYVDTQKHTLARLAGAVTGRFVWARLGDAPSRACTEGRVARLRCFRAAQSARKLLAYDIVRTCNAGGLRNCFHYVKQCCGDIGR